MANDDTIIKYQPQGKAPEHETRVVSHTDRYGNNLTEVLRSTDQPFKEDVLSARLTCSNGRNIEAPSDLSAKLSQVAIDSFLGKNGVKQVPGADQADLTNTILTPSSDVRHHYSLGKLESPLKQLCDAAGPAKRGI